MKSIKKASVKPETQAQVSRFARVLSKVEGEIRGLIDYSGIHKRMEKITEANND